MSLVLCSNQFIENAGDYHSAYSFHNHLSDTLTIPANSEIAVQSVKINKKPRSKEKPSDHTPIELEII